jgi:hypothetical protein
MNLFIKIIYLYMLRKRFILYKISRSISFYIIKVVFFTTYRLRNILHVVQNQYVAKKIYHIQNQ